jgi:hypothetical protein
MLQAHQHLAEGDAPPLAAAATQHQAPTFSDGAIQAIPLGEKSKEMVGSGPPSQYQTTDHALLSHNDLMPRSFSLPTTVSAHRLSPSSCITTPARRRASARRTCDCFQDTCVQGLNIGTGHKKASKDGVLAD